MSAYRFCFKKAAQRNGVLVYKTGYYDFSEKEISEFLSAIVEKYDKYHYHFGKKKNVELGSVGNLVHFNHGASCIKFRGEGFNSLCHYRNSQNLRNMFAIAADKKIPLTIFGRKFLVNYDCGHDSRPLAQDKNFYALDLHKKTFNCGVEMFKKDILFFTAI